MYSFVLLLAAILSSCGGTKEDAEQQIPTGKAVKGTLYIDLHEEGEIEAIRSTNIASPNVSWRYGNLKITQLVKDGDEVQTGDTLIVFDPSEVQIGIVEAESRLEISKAELEKMVAQHQSDLEELKADLEVTRISQEISKIKFESAAYESDVAKKEIELNFEKANIALESAEEQIENRVKIQKEEVKQKNLSIIQDESRLNEAYETLKKMHVVTPSPGIAIVARNWSTGNKFQISEQCWPNFPLIQLPDLSSLKAVVRINEVDISKIKKGLQVQIKPDAFSDSIFTGVVGTVANLAVNKEGSTKIKVFPVEVMLNETDKNLLPGMTVSCRIIIDKIDDVLYVPLDALVTEQDKNYVYKQTSGGFDKVEVEIGIATTDYVVITKGLKENDNIALTNPFAAEEAEEESNEATTSNEG
jgi:RND family efflux transporter MFP subunit